MTRMHLPRADWEALDGGAGWPALESLLIDCPTVGDAGAEAIARAPWRLRHLDLPNGHVGDRGAVALAGSAHLATLERLTLWPGRITDEGAAALASSPHLRSLASLTLRGNLVGAAGVRALGRSRTLPNLRHLDLHENPAPAELRAAVEARFRDGLPPLEDASEPRPLPAVPLPSVPVIGEAAEDGLVRAILADPWDELARNVYSDWLEDRDDTGQAALLRTNEAGRAALLEPVLAGLRQDAPLPNFTPSLTREGLLRIGVPVRSLRSKAFERDGPGWLRRHYVSEVQPEGTARDWLGVFHSAVMAHVRCLRIASVLGISGLQALASSPHLEGLASLDLHVIDREATNNLHLLLASSGWVPCRLCREGPGFGGVRLRQLADTPFAPHLRNLAIGVPGNGLENLSIIAQSPAFAGLVTLTLAGNGLDDAGVIALADSPSLPDLRNLSLERGRLSEAAHRALASSHLLRHLRRLRIVPYLDTEDLAGLARAVADSPFCRLVVDKASHEMRDILGPRLILE